MKVASLPGQMIPYRNWAKDESHQVICGGKQRYYSLLLLQWGWREPHWGYHLCEWSLTLPLLQSESHLVDPPPEKPNQWESAREVWTQGIPCWGCCVEQRNQFLDEELQEWWWCWATTLPFQAAFLGFLSKKKWDSGEERERVLVPRVYGSAIKVLKRSIRRSVVWKVESRRG